MFHLLDHVVGLFKSGEERPEIAFPFRVNSLGGRKIDDLYLIDHIIHAINGFVKEVFLDGVFIAWRCEIFRSLEIPPLVGPPGSEAAILLKVRYNLRQCVELTVTLYVWYSGNGTIWHRCHT